MNDLFKRKSLVRDFRGHQNKKKKIELPMQQRIRETGTHRWEKKDENRAKREL